MAYTSKVSEEKMNRPFATRLRELMQESTEPRKIRKILADYVGVREQAIGAYARGESVPTLENAQRIADYFHVSLDYLSGADECKDMSLEKIHEKIGLSEVAISTLYNMKISNIMFNELKIINSLIEQLSFNKIEKPEDIELNSFLHTFKKDEPGHFQFGKSLDDIYYFDMTDTIIGNITSFVNIPTIDRYGMIITEDGKIACGFLKTEILELNQISYRKYGGVNGRELAEHFFLEKLIEATHKFKAQWQGE